MAPSEAEGQTGAEGGGGEGSGGAGGGDEGGGDGAATSLLSMLSSGRLIRSVFSTALSSAVVIAPIASTSASAVAPTGSITSVTTDTADWPRKARASEAAGTAVTSALVTFVNIEARLTLKLSKTNEANSVRM